MTPQLILAIVGICVEKGLPALVNILNAWRNDDPDFKDINKLHDLVKKPEDYFK